jgi:hypothetical protein
MTSKTRRRVFVCVVVAALTLPAESILLKALETPTVDGAAQAWVASLPPDALTGAAASIQSLPFAYRRQIMTALSPWLRSRVWRRHIATYVENHPELDSNAVALLQAASDLASPDNLANPTDTSRAQIDIVGNQIKALLGKDTAEFLLYRLGPADGTFVSALPISQRLANAVRSTFVALARADDCECNMDWGCTGLMSYCAQGSGCMVHSAWPACGWFWQDPCNGACKVGGLGGS